MKQTILTLLAGALAAASFAPPVPAQTGAGVLSTNSTAPTSTTSTAPRKPTSASAEMVNEAIQRSEARAAKEAATGVPQRWGSEEPFTYNPNIRRFNANQQ